MIAISEQGGVMRVSLTLDGWHVELSRSASPDAWRLFDALHAEAQAVARDQGVTIDEAFAMLLFGRAP